GHGPEPRRRGRVGAGAFPRRETDSARCGSRSDGGAEGARRSPERPRAGYPGEQRRRQIMKGTNGVPVRLQYRKHGKIRWIGHRDAARAMERAFRVAELPLAFSEGFSPHPKVSFGLALSTGHESDAEYLDLVLVDDVDLDALPASLTEALPEGLSVAGAA